MNTCVSNDILDLLLLSKYFSNLTCMIKFSILNGTYVENNYEVFHMVIQNNARGKIICHKCTQGIYQCKQVSWFGVLNPRCPSSSSCDLYLNWHYFCGNCIRIKLWNQPFALNGIETKIKILRMGNLEYGFRLCR